jgi:hypothetical protein
MHRVKVPILFMVLALAICSCGSAGDAQSTEGSSGGGESALVARRPSTVPADFVPTPNGYMHPSCVIELRGDESVRNHRIERADGSTRPLSPCPYSRYDKYGRDISNQRSSANERRTAPPPDTNGWVAWVQSTSTGPLSSTGAGWPVPNTPITPGSQVLYFFIALEPSDRSFVLQPVLGWNAYNDHAWTLTSWNCCLEAIIRIAPRYLPRGDQVGGGIEGSGCADGVCPNWAVYSWNNGTGQITTYYTDSYGQPLDTLFGGVVEAYFVNECSDYPNSFNMRFSGITAQTTESIFVTPSWSTATGPQVPSCGVGFAFPESSGNMSSWWLRGTAVGRSALEHAASTHEQRR